jgi:hypothetical protein
MYPLSHDAWVCLSHNRRCLPSHIRGEEVELDLATLEQAGVFWCPPRDGMIMWKITPRPGVNQKKKQRILE